ncbi:MAG: acyl-CoA dehydrogenase family protein [Jatrophihabitantaceae bacterium]
MRQWTDEQQALRQRYTDSFAAWGEGHIQRDQDSEFPHEQWKLVGESGLLGLPFGAEWGGGAHDLLTTMYVLEGLGYHCRDSGLNFSVATQIVSAGVPIQRFGSADLRNRYLPRICAGTLIGAHAITEPQGGSDAAAMQTTAKRDGDSFVLNGEKCFISNGPVADLFLIYAQTETGNSPFSMTVFAVERGTPGFEIGPPIEKMGLRTSPFGNLSFHDCRVPSANVVGRVGQGFVILDHVMKWEILCNFITSVGTMQNRMERCIEFARSRVQFGAPIGSYQLISTKLVDMKIGVETARMWMYETAERFTAGKDVLTDIAVAKLLASEGNLNSALDAVQIFGGRGYTVGCGLEKDLRDATGGTIYSGTSEIQRGKIARMIGVK